MMRSQPDHRPRRRSAFTLLETLAMVTVLAVAAMVALPAFLGAISDAEAKNCRAAMRSIASAEEEYRVQHRACVGMVSGRLAAPVVRPAVPDEASTPGVLATPPICPHGERYTVVVDADGNGFTVSCPTHGTYRPGTGGY